MTLSLAAYKEKVLGCWVGKNIGGTLGAPFECKRAVYDFDFYTQDLNGEPLPNDDLDLQLVWLNAVEKYGRRTDAKILGEYWLSYIVPNWGEYGAGKNNLRQGIVPPLSGYVNNVFRDSNGAFIRSELWACLAPGHPEIAVQYAYEDAIVDHSHEGVYAEVFFAAIESAAFVENDRDTLIDIGLSYIPADCGVARGAASARDAHSRGLSWQEARIQVLNDVPGSFGIIGMEPDDLPKDVAVGPMGYDAPGNVGITLIGWLYGEGDFGSSICIANNCGEDTDCTAATLGSILGIIGGEAGIPEKWKAPIGDSIKTLCVNLGDQGLRIPKTVGELTERIIRLAPSFLGSDIVDVITAERGYDVAVNEGGALYSRKQRINTWTYRGFEEKLSQSPFQVSYDFVIFSAIADYAEAPFVQEGAEKTVKIIIDNNLFMQQWLTFKWHLPAGWSVSPGPVVGAGLEQYHCNLGRTELTFRLLSQDLQQARYDVLLEISSQGRPTKGIIPFVFINGQPIA
ncbi:ADP-ribosylglycohydrolase family protein [Paenibacillus rhizovicinus]|uniref:ADP-ribosylglycohydrolase family protein n=1 Tax=Paenibacillus rhizovicinus TaxID=2704463 RepID=A0A6C0P0E5_9BACL|nr:ADP-ribosylglycohydrolase family protein [Paenibacillus rhizovicinus]QHW32000.1 ADP-ribosylglycohydrolase family protein [Paenibacillus rhizovicinus]